MSNDLENSVIELFLRLLGLDWLLIVRFGLAI
jgi:hypothetical protein